MGDLIFKKMTHSLTHSLTHNLCKLVEPRLAGTVPVSLLSITNL